MKTSSIAFTDGWYPEESVGHVSFRWMSKRSVCVLKGIPTKGRRWLMIMGGHPLPKGKNPRLTVSTRHEVLGQADIFPGTRNYYFPIKGRSEDLEVVLEVDQAFPRELTGDPRQLGMTIEQIKVYAEEAAFFPSVLELEPSTFCNINPPCVMCYPRLFDRRPYEGEIDQAVFDKLVPSFKDFRAISLYGVGEPLVGKKLGVILDNIDTDTTLVQFNSNGLLLTEAACRSLIRQKLNLINFSLDAATPETYRKIRRSDFDLVIRNISRLSEIKKELGVKIPVIQVNMTLMKENQSEILLFLDLAHRVGAEIVHLGLLNPFREYEVENEGFTFNYLKQMIDPRSEGFRKTMEQAERRASELGLQLLTEFTEYRPS